MISVFLFQAEDGRRDYKVTGVQTCALPILGLRAREGRVRRSCGDFRWPTHCTSMRPGTVRKLSAAQRPSQTARTWSIKDRSEERRVGKESRARREENSIKKK